MGCKFIKDKESRKSIDEKGINHQNKKKEYKKISMDIIKFSKDALNQHNKYRKEHNASPLELDNDLQNYAQNHAEEMAKKNEIFHSNCVLNNDVIGENIYSNQKIFTGTELTDEFYKDIQFYDFNENECVIKASNFTQLIWKNTQYVGFGVAYNLKTGNLFAVAIYSPPGNELGNYKNNVENKINEKNF